MRGLESNQGKRADNARPATTATPPQEQPNFCPVARETNQSRNAAESFLDPLRTEPGGHDHCADRSRRQEGRLDSRVKRREVKTICQFSFCCFSDRAADRVSFQPCRYTEG